MGISRLARVMAEPALTGSAFLLMRTTPVPLLTEAIALRVEDASRDYMIAQLAALQSWDGNVYGARMEQFGEATAFLVRNAPNILFNRVMGLGPRNADDVAAIASWYRAARRKCRLDIVPSRADAALLRRMAQHGWYQSYFYGALYGAPHPAKGRSDVVVHKVGRDDVEVFMRAYVEGFGLTTLSAAADAIRALFGRPAIHFYLAAVDDAPAAVAILSLSRGVGYLAASATRPPFRGRGCQTALLRRRIADAGDAGCDLVVGHTGVLSGSYRNMERAGLRLAYTKALWTPYDTP